VRRAARAIALAMEVVAELERIAARVSIDTEAVAAFRDRAIRGKDGALTDE
jgi:hypothetical protein